MSHGAGGKSSAALVDAVFVEGFRNEALKQLGDGAVPTLPSGEQLPFSTDSFVVPALRFGGSIGHLAAEEAANDLAIARPYAAAFVLEEGFPHLRVAEIITDVAAGRAAGVR